MLLALDTSTSLASIALYDGNVVAEITWYSGRNHSVEMMSQAAGLMKLRHTKPTELQAVAVATGPGSYTGLRVGLSGAKGLALALGIPLVGVPSLDVLAEPHRWNCLPVRPVLHAGRNRYATALYLPAEGELRREGPIEGLRMTEIVSTIRSATLLCGDVGECREMDLPETVLLASPASSLRRAGFLAEIAWRKLRAGNIGDPAAVDAFYLGTGS